METIQSKQCKKKKRLYMCLLSVRTIHSHIIHSMLGLCIHAWWRRRIYQVMSTSLLYRQLRARRALSIVKDVPSITRRALLLYNVYGDSALLLLNGTFLNSDNTLLALNWWYITWFPSAAFHIDAASCIIFIHVALLENKMVEITSLSLYE